MSSYGLPDPWQSAQGLIDPLTGLPKKKKAAPSGFNQGQVNASMSANPNATFGPSPNVNYGFGTSGRPQLPGMPNYRALIDNDPTYQQAKLDFGAQGVSDAASRAAQTQRALTLFGGPLPQFEQMNGLNQEFLNQDVTAQTRQLAQQNTDAGLSIAARQAKAFKDQLRQIKNALGARGALQSGEAGHALQEAQLGYDQSKFDTTNELVEFLSGLQAGFAEKQRQEKLRLAQGATDAEGRVRQQYPYSDPGSTGAGQLPPPPAPPVESPYTTNVTPINYADELTAAMDKLLASRGFTPGGNKRAEATNRYYGLG